jgi:predicted transcriptional regulator of viral defense system
MKEYNQIRYWVEELPKLGRNTFSLLEVREVFSQKSSVLIKNALNRLVASNCIRSVWRGFYAIVLPEYGIRGIIPPTEYIDHLMAYLKKDYYISTLSAAALQGASHQKPQVFTFVSNRILHTKEKNETRLEPLLKKHIPYNYIDKMNVRSGTINISKPILTAIDLILYPFKTGGFGNIITILSELSEVMNIESINDDFFDYIPASAVQRLGYLLDGVLYERELSDSFYEKAISASVAFRKIPLVSYKDINLPDLTYNSKWKVIINEEVVLDI